MNEYGDQLRDTFEAHENLAPDAAAVYARVEELSRTYLRRRRGVQAAGGAALGVGLVAGGLNLSSVLPGSHSTVTVQAAPAAAPASAPTPAITLPPQTKKQTEKDLDAYFGAGYGLDEGHELAKIWHVKNNLLGVKAEAGRRLLAGETLPVKPENPPLPVNRKEERDVNAFFGAGYTYNDAVKLAGIWKTADPYHAKVKGGEKILAGETLPIKP